MKRFITLLALFFLIVSCKTENKKEVQEAPAYKIPVHAWMGLQKDATDEDLKAQFDDLKGKGVDRLMYSAGHDPEVYRRVGKIAKASGLEFHTWIPTMVQNDKPQLKQEWYAVN